MITKLLTGIFVGALAFNFASATEMASQDAMSNDTMVKDTIATDTMVKDTMTSNTNSSDMYDKVSPMSNDSDIAKLQMMLVEKGYLKMPTGVAYGYYGKLTTNAFKKYKDAKMMKEDTMTTSTEVVKDTIATDTTSSDMYDKVSPMSNDSDIAKLQMMLVEKGYLTMPMGVSYGYYGKLTTNAFKKYKDADMMKKDSTAKDVMGTQ